MKRKNRGKNEIGAKHNDETRTSHHHHHHQQYHGTYALRSIRVCGTLPE